MKLVTLLLPEAYVMGLDKLLEEGLYPSRSAAIRFAVQDLLRRELWRQEVESIKEEAVVPRKVRVKRLPERARPEAKSTHRKGYCHAHMANV